MARIIPLYSGSSGNCTYIGTSTCGVLIDVGKNAKQTKMALESAGIDPDAIKGILITHEHSDHISGVDVFARQLGLDVYGTAATLAAMENKGTISPKIRLRAMNGPLDIAGMEVQCFPTSHDSADCCGYIVTAPGGAKAGLATDLGVMTPTVLGLLSRCKAVVLESNYDEKMLRTGPYPYILKQRIASSVGHLSNTDCANALPVLVDAGVQRLILAHLSDKNNAPDLAMDTSLRTLTTFQMEQNKDYQLQVARRNSVTPAVIF